MLLGSKVLSQLGLERIVIKQIIVRVMLIITGLAVIFAGVAQMAELSVSGSVNWILIGITTTFIIVGTMMCTVGLITHVVVELKDLGETADR